MKIKYFFLIIIFSLKVSSQATIFPDTNFDIGSGFNNSQGVNTVVQQSDGKILVGGEFTNFNGLSKNRLVRLNSNGSIDLDFNIGSGFGGFVNSIVIQPDGKILIGGTLVSYNGTLKRAIVRLNSDGSLDSNFNVENIFANCINQSGGGGYVLDIKIQNDGKILCVGSFLNLQGYNNIIRLNQDGSIDYSFCVCVSLYTTPSIAIQNDGKILIGLYQTVMRLNNDGSVDYTFNCLGLTGGSNGLIFSIAIDIDNKILVGGQFSSFNGSNQNYLVRLNSDGSLDNNFNLGVAFSYSILPNYGNVQTILPLSNGKILIGGQFDTFNGYNSNYLIKLNSDGTRDNGFNIGIGFNLPTHIIFLQPDGKLLIGGNFSAFNGQDYNNLIRLSDNNLSANSFLDKVSLITIYPNPTNSKISINCSNQIDLIGSEIKITNALGQEIYKSILSQQIQDISLSSVATSGLYFVTVVNKSGNTITTKKIMLQ